MNFFTARFSTIHGFIQTQRFPLGDWKNIFSWSYWTESFLPSSSPYTLVTILVVLLIVIVLIVWQLRLKRLHKVTPIYQSLLNQVPSLIAFVVTIAIVYLFARAQQIQYLSSRLVILGSLIVLIGWLAILIYHSLKILPAKRLAYLEKERFFRYLPKKRK